jgi:carbon monoxide dehydrogenase subunit G
MKTMKLQFAGEKKFPMPPAELWQKLRDARFVAEAIPDGQPGEVNELDRAAATIKPSFSFLSGTLDVLIEVAEAVEPSSLRWLLTSKGIGNSSVVEAHINLTPAGNDTHVNWNAEVKEVTGLLKALPGGLIRGAAQRVIDDVWAGVEKKLST